MIRRLIFITVVCVFVSAPALADPTHGTLGLGSIAQMTRVGGYYSGTGGEFTLFDPGAGNWQLDASKGYASSTYGLLSGHPESFQTFCIEKDEYSYYNEWFDVWVSLDNKDGTIPGSHAWGGGVNVPATPEAAQGDDLDPKTAYLYNEFARGTLSSYEYTAGPGRVASAAELQEAIWSIEQEIGPANGQAATWITEAAAAVAPGGTWYERWGEGSIGYVRVLQNSNVKQYRQDFLYVVPVPAAVLLGILGLGVAGWRLRKFA